MLTGMLMYPTLFRCALGPHNSVPGYVVYADMRAIRYLGLCAYACPSPMHALALCIGTQASRPTRYAGLSSTGACAPYVPGLADLRLAMGCTMRRLGTWCCVGDSLQTRCTLCAGKRKPAEGGGL
jgi:hypothetical protein